MSRSRMRTTAGPAKRRGAMPKASRRRTTAANRGTKRSGALGSSPRSKATARGSTQRSAKPVTDHNRIRKWAETRGGHPAIVKRSAKGKGGGGILRIDFPGFSGAGSLKPISWDEWFDIFEERRLAMLFQDKTASGKPSRFNKLVCR